MAGINQRYVIRASATSPVVDPHWADGVPSGKANPIGVCRSCQLVPLPPLPHGMDALSLSSSFFFLFSFFKAFSSFFNPCLPPIFIANIHVSGGNKGGYM
jgi:hypothetical protein